MEEMVGREGRLVRESCKVVDHLHGYHRGALKVSLRPTCFRRCLGVLSEHRRSAAGVSTVRWMKKRGFPGLE
ncbi:hypothetical protein LR48_Vigan08g047300 [Vigna angularis]|uniref:Uncharacterized protein n=1 Tax=Phaseolus angularis TaxID=3914 RepID=A0A0L9V3U3_PHAAN|nr:hypothetical protein LR48_Vigan08g047300 [Vigna angularis]